jgi:hypothetical protein
LLEVAHHVQALCVCDHNVFVVVCVTFRFGFGYSALDSVGAGPSAAVFWMFVRSVISTRKAHAALQPGRIQDWSADSHVRAFLASDQVRADKAALRFSRFLNPPWGMGTASSHQLTASWQADMSLELLAPTTQPKGQT